MQVISTLNEIRQLSIKAKNENKRIAFVPTMGFLHAGHQQLINTARIDCEILVVSIFVNPLQFAPTEDFDDYPRNIKQDTHLCEINHVDILFTPKSHDIIGDQSPLTKLHVGTLGEYLCGATRIGHFDGVCTILCKLFNLIQPNKVYMGQKDIQQLRIVQQMVSDLNFPIEIIGVPTVRANDGLALSSRNSYLSQDERSVACIVPQIIDFIKTETIKGSSTIDEILQSAKSKLLAEPLAKIDYIQIVNYSNLQPATDFKQPIIIAVAIYIGGTRLIDNLILDCSHS